jgi:hypothetical protein
LAKSWAPLSLTTPSGCRNSPSPPPHPRSIASATASLQRLGIHLPRSAPPLGSPVAAARSEPSSLLPGSPRLVPPSAPWLGFELPRLCLARDRPHGLCYLGRQPPAQNPSRRQDLRRRPTATSWCPCAPCAPCALLPPASLVPTRQPILHSSTLQVHTQHLLHSSALQVSSL